MARSNLSHLPTAVPSDVRPKYEAITALTDAFCKRRLNEEYAEMCRRLAAALARRQPTPLVGGREAVWACGIVRTIGWVNILDDPSTSPHMKLIDIDPRFGVANSTGQGKSKAIRRMLGIGRLNPDWTLPSRYADNPLVWNVVVNGTLVDIRKESRERQAAAFQKGLIPYIPADQTTIADEHTEKPPDNPSLDSMEGGVFEALFDFYEKLMALLRGANLSDEKVKVAGKRIHLLMTEITQHIKRTRDLNIQARLDSMHEEVKRLVDDLTKGSEVAKE
ncbi:MAG: DUF6398 domain-containing protein [Patescibacteria group bacterium]|nr:DUF6398 domain-containing protein [Patescibacteria group bacterium]